MVSTVTYHFSLSTLEFGRENAEMIEQHIFNHRKVLEFSDRNYNHCDCEPIDRVSNRKYDYLEVLSDNNLKWNSHFT